MMLISELKALLNLLIKLCNFLYVIKANTNNIYGIGNIVLCHPIAIGYEQIHFVQCKLREESISLLRIDVSLVTQHDKKMKSIHY